MGLFVEGYKDYGQPPADHSFQWISIDDETKTEIARKLLMLGVDMAPVEGLAYIRPDSEIKTESTRKFSVLGVDMMLVEGLPNRPNNSFDARGDHIDAASQEVLNDPTLPRLIGNKYFFDETNKLNVFNIQPLMFVNYSVPHPSNPSETTSAIILCRYSRAPLAVYERARDAFLTNVNNKFARAGLSEFPPHKR